MARLGGACLLLGFLPEPCIVFLLTQVRLTSINLTIPLVLSPCLHLPSQNSYAVGTQMWTLKFRDTPVQTSHSPSLVLHFIGICSSEHL